MKKLISLALSLSLATALFASGASEAPGKTAASSQQSGPKAYKVALIIENTIDDKGWCQAMHDGILEAQKELPGRIEYSYSEKMAPVDAGSVARQYAAKGYDLIICGTYQMPDYLKEVATQYPDQLYAIFDDTTYVGECENIVNISFRQNDLGYLCGVLAGALTGDTSFEKINPEKVVGFVGGVDSPVINDFLIGYIEGAKSVNPDIKVDVRYTNDYVDTAIAKEFGLSMINDNHCDLIWGVAGNAGNGAAEAAFETGKAYFLGVDSDQELTLSSDLAAITLTSGLKNIGNSLIWFFDEMDAGRTYFGQEVSLGLAEGGVGIVTDKNFATFANDDLKAAITAAEEAIKAGDVVVDSALAEGGPDLAVQLKNEVQP